MASVCFISRPFCIATRLPNKWRRKRYISVGWWPAGSRLSDPYGEDRSPRAPALFCNSGTRVEQSERHRTTGQDEKFLDGAVRDDGLVWGTYIHGLFDRPVFRRAWLNRLRIRKGLSALDLFHSQR